MAHANKSADFVIFPTPEGYQKVRIVIKTQFLPPVRWFMY